MPENLLQTKLFIPQLRPNMVPRPRLIERLNHGLDLKHKLTLVCAPAGFGKTTLITDWIQKSNRVDDEIEDERLLPASPVVHPSNVAWLALDKNDNDPNRFLTHFTAALNHAEPGLGQDIGAMISSAQPAVMEPFMGAIINEIMGAIASTPLVFILEDYHFIDSPAIHDGLNFLLDHLPPRMHLIITSRSDPPLFLPRLRARNQMTEIRARDLRFTSREVADFLSQTMGLNLTAEMVMTFEERTEGWIAGLQLAAISLKQQDDPVGFVTAFAGDDRYVADYLMVEVFQHQPVFIQNFLLGTSILDSFSAPLCDAVTAEHNSRTILNQLEASNLFIVPLDSHRRWYRYHHLFADLLRQRLEEFYPRGEIELLHKRASTWYEENDLLIAAVEHALAAEDFQGVIRLVEEGGQEILRGSQMNTLLRWWEDLPLELVESRPKLCLIYSWAWLATGHPEESESCLLAIEQELGATMDEFIVEERGAKSIEPADLVALEEIAVIRGQLAIVGGDIAEALKLSRLVLPYLEEDGQPFIYNPPANLRTIAHFNMGVAHKLRGELGRAEQALSEAILLGQKQENVHVVAAAFGNLASAQAIQGELNQAMQTCQRGLQIVQEMAGRSSPLSGRLQVELGALLYEHNDLESSLHHLQDGISVAKPWGYMDALIPGYTGLARLRATTGDWSGAVTALDELARLGRRTPESVMPTVESFRARLWVAQGNVEAAGHWAATVRLHLDGDLNYLQEEESIILVRVLIAQQRWIEAALLITRLLDLAKGGERWGRVIQLLILRALAFDAQDQPGEALESLAEAVRLAEPQGYVRIFVDEGEPMAQLLYRAVANGKRPGYSGKLLSVLHDSESLAAAESDLREPESRIIEPLSAREIEVLDCLTEGLSNREIAQQLTISLTTVKTHTRNIYRKLDVNSRTQAVARGKALGIS